MDITPPGEVGCLECYLRHPSPSLLFQLIYQATLFQITLSTSILYISFNMGWFSGKSFVFDLTTPECGPGLTFNLAIPRRLRPGKQLPAIPKHRT